MERPDQAQDQSAEGDDPITAREELEQDLMEDDASEAGEQIGDEEG
jgi:hypothetical protein